MQIKVREDKSFDNNEYFRVWCKNVAGNDVKFYEEDGGDWTVNGVWHAREAAVDSSCLIADARFKITMMANDDAEDVFIDDFVIIKHTEILNT